MSTHKYTSWGRTRGPKNVTGKNKHFATGSNIADLSGLTADKYTPTYGVYRTENQRYMHIHCSGSNSGVSKVYTYLYASQQWSELVVLNPGASNALVSVSCGANQTRIVDIMGADIVAVLTGSATFLPHANYLAFSTF